MLCQLCLFVVGCRFSHRSTLFDFDQFAQALQGQLSVGLATNIWRRVARACASVLPGVPSWKGYIWLAVRIAKEFEKFGVILSDIALYDLFRVFWAPCRQLLTKLQHEVSDIIGEEISYGDEEIEVQSFKGDFFGFLEIFLKNTIASAGLLSFTLWLN
jgi:hypothetical protein